MSLNSFESNSESNWFTLNGPNPFKKIIWISIGTVFVIAILDLTGWIFDFTVLKSIMPQWIPMKIITAVCFLLAAASLVIVQINLSVKTIRILTAISSGFIILTGIITAYVYLYTLIMGQEPGIVNNSFLSVILTQPSRMAFLTACCFVLIGFIIFLIGSKRKTQIGLAHALLIPVMVVSYYDICSYLLGVYISTKILGVSVALNTGLASAGLSIAILMLYTDTWLTKVFTSPEIGGIVARKLLPGVLILPAVIGWFRIQAESKKIVTSEVGVVLVAITYFFCFVLLVWITARLANRIDRKRLESESALKKSHKELTQLNRTLNAHSKSSKAMMHARDEQRFLDEVCKIIVEDCGHQLAWIGYAQNDTGKSVKPVASYGFENGYIDQLKITWDDSERGCGPTGTTIKTGTPTVCRNMLTDQKFKPWREAALQNGYASSLVLPLMADGKPFGALSIYSKKPDPFSDSEIDLLSELVQDLEYGISHLRLEAAEKEALNILKESEKKFSTVFYSAPIAMSLATIPDGILYDVNDAWLRLVEIQDKSLAIGKTTPDLGLIPERISRENILMEFKENGFAKNIEMLAVTRTGRRVNMLVNVHKIELQGESYMLSTNEDITELKHAEKELNSTKNYLENLINYANAPIIVWDPSTRIRLFNRAFEHLTGYQSNEMLDNKLEILFPEESAADSNEKIKLSLLERWETIEIPILCKNGEVKTVHWNSANIYDPENKILVSTIAQGHDITGRKKAEEELRLSREKLDLALDNANVGVWEWDIVTNVITWDVRMENIFGIGAGTFGGNYDAFESFLPDEDKTHVRSAINKALEYDAPFDTVYRIKTADGNIKHISAKALLSKHPQGKPKKMTGVCFDITEMRKGAEQALFKLNEDLLRSNKELEQFAYVASHDLQEPLRMVSSFTQLLAQRYKDKLDSDANDFIQFAVDGALRMQNLINDLLEFSRVHTRGKSLTETDMNQVLDNTIINLSPKIQEKKALITRENLPVINADSGQMVQLLQNLIGNSLKFCKTTPKIHVSAVEENDFYLFIVRDNGIGIEPQYFEKIFSIFQRLHQKEEYEGTGIGLAICKRIIERHGGRIYIESKPGKGSSFKFTIRKNK
jgi:PAS domain S-box-containing protein